MSFSEKPIEMFQLSVRVCENEAKKVVRVKKSYTNREQKKGSIDWGKMVIKNQFFPKKRNKKTLRKNPTAVE